MSILVNLQHQYANDPNALLYFCINQSHLVGGIRSSVHSLNYNQPDTMVKQFMSDFYHYINSNADVKLDATFECFFHIISSKTLNKPGHRRTAVPVRSLVGSNIYHSKSRLKGSLINLPAGSPKSPTCFENACLLVTVVFMFIKKMQQNLYGLIGQLIMVRPGPKAKNVAADILLNEVRNVCDQTQLSFLGPHELEPTLTILSGHLKVNLIVIRSLDGRTPELSSYPKTMDMAMPRLYFLLQSNDKNPDHILAIDNLATFFKSRKRAICFACQTTYSLKWGLQANRHKCHHKLVCQKCFGFTFDTSTVIDSTEPWWYCDALIKDSTTQCQKCCFKCGTVFESLRCYENHYKYFCKKNLYYYQCPCCQKSISMKKRPLEVVQAEHQCDVEEKYCNVCFKVMPLNHICTVSKKEKDKVWPGLAVLSITFEDASGTLCQICYARQSKHMLRHNLTYAQFFKSKEYHELLCDNHKITRVSVPNVIKVFYESERFSFVGQTFSNDNFLLAVTPLNETMLSTYSSDVKPLPSNSPKPNQVHNLTNLKSASSQFLHFLKKANLANYTFAVHTGQEMLWLLDFFLSEYLHPTVVQTGRVVKKISLPSFKIDFLLFENYCKGSLNDLSEQFGLNRATHYYPMVYNQKNYYGQIIQKPEFETFLNFTDSSQEVNLKHKYYHQLPDPFDTNAQLYKVITENLKTFLLSVVRFIEYSFQVQRYLADMSNLTETAACHPFGTNVMSLSAFAMAVFKYYIYNAFDGYSVDRPYTGFYSKVSAPEYEYLSFLSYTKPEEKIVYAFNRREGQMRFDNMVVADGYSPESRTVYQFHGCMVIYTLKCKLSQGWGGREVRLSTKVAFTLLTPRAQQLF